MAAEERRPPQINVRRTEQARHGGKRPGLLQKGPGAGNRAGIRRGAPPIPEHPRGLDYDREQANSGQYAGWVFNVAYARAMLQAALASA